jgi:hypothetical protein
MMRLFTIVKDELDVVAEWVHYHGRLFGYENLYIIDNMSTDGTYEKLLELQDKHGCSVFQQPNYALKGVYMTQLIREYCSHKNESGNYTTPIAYPIDIDEFIAMYDAKTHTITCDKHAILAYFEQTVLPKIASNEYAFFKTNYVLSKIINNGASSEFDGYKNAVMESTHGAYLNYGNMAKTFFSSKKFIEDGIQNDHGNHFSVCEHFMTDLVLVHYNCRSRAQMEKKVYNNVAGFGYPVNDVTALARYLTAPGNHHVKHRIDILNNMFKLPAEPFDDARPISESHISLAPLSDTFNIPD